MAFAKENPTEDDLRNREYQRKWRAKNRYSCIQSNRNYRERLRDPNMKRRNRIAVGQKYARLLVLGLSKESKRGVWIFLCDCGKEHLARGSHVTAGWITSCGCFKDEHAGEYNLTHGHTVNGPSAEYRTWQNIIKRCEDPQNIVFHRYGAVGISVCERWHHFPNFLHDMGLRPSDGHSIDRYPDKKGNYEPDNCRWATAKEQTRNRKNTVRIEIAGETISLAEACERYSVKYLNAYALLRAGRSVERIFGKAMQHVG